MSLRRYAGSLLRGDGGALANNDNCCCEPVPDFCGGCIGNEIEALQIEFDATGVVSNPNVTICECTDGECDAFSGTYITTVNGDAINFTTCDDGDELAHYCYWCTETNVESPGICDGGITGFCYGSWGVRIGAIDGIWYLVVEFGISDLDPATDPISCAAQHVYTWIKVLGEEKPNCADVFPVTLTPADYVCPTGFVEEVNSPCFYSGAGTITISIV